MQVLVSQGKFTARYNYRLDRKADSCIKDEGNRIWNGGILGGPKFWDIVSRYVCFEGKALGMGREKVFAWWL